MNLIQILIAVFAILIIVKTFRDFKKKIINRTFLLFWSVLWLVILVVAAHPQITELIAVYIGVSRGTDVAVYFSILFIFLAIFKIVNKLEKIESNITKIVRSISLKDKQ